MVLLGACLRYQARIRDLEERLLNELSGVQVGGVPARVGTAQQGARRSLPACTHHVTVLTAVCLCPQGNILDDDTIMVSLETLKKDASEVAQQVANTAEIMASVDAVTNFYEPFAVAASRM